MRTNVRRRGGGGVPFPPGGVGRGSACRLSRHPSWEEGDRGDAGGDPIDGRGSARRQSRHFLLDVLSVSSRRGTGGSTQNREAEPSRYFRLSSFQRIPAPRNSERCSSGSS